MDIGDRRPEREELAWLALALLRGVAPGRALALSRELGGAAAVLRAAPTTLSAHGLRASAIAEVAGARARAESELLAIARAGARLVAWDAPDYPERLRGIADPPLALVVQGSLVADEPAVAVVGARRASVYGTRLAGELATGLAHAGIAVVSGLAAGIDAAAHRAALAAGGRTVAVLGTGIDVVYPSWHRELAAQVARGGALVSEFACGTPGLQLHFPRRNRIISGMTLGTIVVEAAERSGSLITARLALEQGREVFAVPGPVGPALHRGPHRLVQQGAKLVTCVEDVLDEIAPALVKRVAVARAAAAEAALATTERRVLAAMGDGAAHVDQVIGGCGLTAAEALETLLALEIRGLVEQMPGKRFRRRAA
ncbi:MAG: DNA-processing protein DprA [Candidatus Binatia bacterium]